MSANENIEKPAKKEKQITTSCSNNVIKDASIKKTLQDKDLHCLPQIQLKEELREAKRRDIRKQKETIKGN